MNEKVAGGDGLVDCIPVSSKIIQLLPGRKQQKPRFWQGAVLEQGKKGVSLLFTFWPSPWHCC